MNPPHGTSARYQQHIKDGERACKPCKAAAADYLRKWRKRTGGIHGRASAKARSRALIQLKDLHADEFEALFLDQLRAVDQEREPST